MMTLGSASRQADVIPTSQSHVLLLRRMRNLIQVLRQILSLSLPRPDFLRQGYATRRLVKITRVHFALAYSTGISRTAQTIISDTILKHTNLAALASPSLFRMTQIISVCFNIMSTQYFNTLGCLRIPHSAGYHVVVQRLFAYHITR